MFITVFTRSRVVAVFPAVDYGCPGGVHHHDWSVVGWSRQMSLLRVLRGCAVVKLEVTVQSVKVKLLL
jgi:hypothetical protein